MEQHSRGRSGSGCAPRQNYKIMPRSTSLDSQTLWHFPRGQGVGVAVETRLELLRFATPKRQLIQTRRAANTVRSTSRRASENAAEHESRLAAQRGRNTLSNARRSGQAAVAAAAGGVSMESTAVTAEQLRDAEHDPIAAMLLMAESSGSNKWTVPLRAVRRATTAEERPSAAEALIALIKA